MRKTLRITALLLLLTLSACERRPLLDLQDTHYIRIYIDEEIPNVTTGFYDPNNVRPAYTSPGIMRVTLADRESGNIVSERFLRNMGEDERGKYYDGYIVATPGRYSLMAYNFDMETTQISDINNYYKAKAYTNEIAAHLKAKIPSRTEGSKAQKAPGYDKVVYDPDHLFRVSHLDVVVPYVDYIDTLRTVDGGWFRAESDVHSYYLQVKVKGLEFATSSVGLLTGLSGSSWVKDGAMDVEDPVTVYFDLHPGHGSAGIKQLSSSGAPSSESVIYTTFNTFGKIPNLENELEITFDFLTVYGKPYSETLNITDVFATPEARNNRWLLIDHCIEIPEPPKVGGGGFDPGLDDWEDIESDIEI